MTIDNVRDGILRIRVETPTLRFNVSSFGAVVSSVQLKQQGGGEWRELTAAYDDLDELLSDTAHMGSTCGRFTGRIMKGKFTLDGVEYQLSVNNNGNTLHGGAEGFDKRRWEVIKVLDGSDADGGRLGISLGLLSPHLDQGFPAALRATASYFTLVGHDDHPQLHMKFDAEIDTSSGPSGLNTVVNLVNHNYWNLNGFVRSGNDDVWPQPLSVTNHVLQIDADSVTVMDEFSVSTGAILSVDGTPFDFRIPHVIGERIEAEPLLRKVPGYDDNFILSTPYGSMRHAATISSPATGISMEILTTLPALQVYTTNYKPKDASGKKDDRFGFRSAVCLETQFFPNAPNCPNFPSTVLRPGEVWSHETIHRFSQSSSAS